MAICSFALTELSGVFSVYLYITRYKHTQRKKMQQMLKNEPNDRGNRWRYRKHLANNQNRDRSQSRDRCSRDPSLSRSESYYTYTPISDNTSHELSNYTFQRDVSRNTISTTVESHNPRDHVVRDHVTRENATRENACRDHISRDHIPLPSESVIRRTTPV